MTIGYHLTFTHDPDDTVIDNPTHWYNAFSSISQGWARGSKIDFNSGGYSAFVLLNSSGMQILFVIGKNVSSGNDGYSTVGSRWDIHGNVYRAVYVAIDWQGGLTGDSFWDRLYNQSMAPSNSSFFSKTATNIQTKAFRLHQNYYNGPSVDTHILWSDSSASGNTDFIIAQTQTSSTYLNDISTVVISDNFFDCTSRPVADRLASNEGFIALNTSTNSNYSDVDLYSRSAVTNYRSNYPIGQFWLGDGLDLVEPIGGTIYHKHPLVFADNTKIRGLVRSNLLEIGSYDLPIGIKRDNGNLMCGPKPFLWGWENTANGGNNIL